MQNGINMNKAIDYIIKGETPEVPKEEIEHSINVAVISHAYNLYDNRISLDVFDKLESLGVKSYAAENLSMDEMKKGFAVLDTTLYWANEYEITGAAGHYLVDKKIDGVITLTAFGCGPDSIMVERITRFAKRLNKPLLNLTVDEHTGEAGFITRLEAFTDMLVRRKRTSFIKSIEKQFDGEEQKVSQNQAVGF